MPTDNSGKPAAETLDLTNVPVEADAYDAAAQLQSVAHFLRLLGGMDE